MVKSILLVSLLVFSSYAQERIVKDTKHHLQWQDNSEAEENIWKMAIGYCKQLDINTHNDWRLPTQIELVRLAKSESLKKQFQYLESYVYWSSDLDKNEELNAVTVFSDNGFVSSSDKCDKNFIICVRDDK